MRIVQIQLGHSTPMLMLGTYGAFILNAEDRAHWREHVAEAAARGTGKEFRGCLVQSVVQSRWALPLSL